MTNQIRLTRYRVISRWIVLSFVVCLALFVLLPGSAGAQDKKPTIITIDVPKAVGSVATIALNINPEGQITGNYLDANSMPHGFVRDPDGNFTEFDYPISPPGGFPTVAEGINPRGAVAGYYLEPVSDYYVYSGYLRHPDGNFTMVDVPWAGTGPIYNPSGCPFTCVVQGTEATNINAVGVIAGTYVDSNLMLHGFLRYPDATYITVDDPFAYPGPKGGPYIGLGTWVSGATGINPAGAVSGGFMDQYGATHGFVRDPDGRFTEFHAPDAGTTCLNYIGAWCSNSAGTQTSAINQEGAVTGWYVENSGATYGFVRDQYGKITEFNYPGAVGTAGVAIDPAGAITGDYTDSEGYTHGFVRDPNGNFTCSFDGALGALVTAPVAINPAGEITGFYYASDGSLHGFLLIP